MTDQEIRIAVAEAVGWKWHGDKTWDEKADSFYWKRGDSIYRQLPNYPEDLNAMHEAEKALAPSQRRSYATNLLEVCNPNHEHSIDTLIYCYQNYIFATARQRAEAFLRTLNKRKD